MKTYVTSITIETSVLSQVLKMQDTNMKSTAVLRCLNNFMILNKKTRKKISNRDFMLITQGNLKFEKLSIRLPQNIKETLQQTFPNTPISDAVNWICAYLIHSTPPSSPQSMHLLRILGSKWNSKLQDAISGILKSCNRTWSTRIETCAGALGSFAPFPIGDMEILNDIDAEKFDLYKVIQESPSALLKACKKFTVDESCFDAAQNLDLASLSKVQKVARYIYLNLTSANQNSCDFSKDRSTEYYNRVISCIPTLSKRLADVKLTRRDLFNTLNVRTADTLYVVDPPYLDTASVYKSADKRCNSFEWHQTLSRKLWNLHNTYGADFIIFCRITGRRKDQRKQGTIADLYMEARINSLYAGKGAFYRDVKLDKVTIERIITTFNFDGATPYI